MSISPDTGGGDDEAPEPGEDAIPANMPEWSPELWDLTIEFLGAGENFIQGRCEEGNDEIVWHFGSPEEVKNLGEGNAVGAQQTWGGGMLRTPFRRSVVSAIFNGLADPDATFDWGIVVGIHVCVDENDDIISGGNWENVSDENRWNRMAGYRIDETIAYRIFKDFNVPEEAPEVSEVIDPMSEFDSLVEQSAEGGVKGVEEPEPEPEPEPEEEAPEGEPVFSDDEIQEAIELTQENDIGTEDFFEFRSVLLDADFEDSEVSPMWETLRNAGVIGEGEEAEAEETTEEPEPTPTQETEPEPTPTEETTEPEVTREVEPGSELAQEIEKEIDDFILEKLDEQFQDLDADVRTKLTGGSVEADIEAEIRGNLGLGDEKTSTDGGGKKIDRDSTDGSEDLEKDWGEGDGVLLTQPSCPACMDFKKRDDVQDALQSGALVEVNPDHPDYDTIVEQSGAEVTPAVVRYLGPGAGFVQL